jgi:hypothetical protein
MRFIRSAMKRTLTAYRGEKARSSGGVNHEAVRGARVATLRLLKQNRLNRWRPGSRAVGLPA